MIQLGVRSKHGNQYGKHYMVSFVSTFSSLSLKTELPHSVLKEKKWVVEREGKWNCKLGFVSINWKHYEVCYFTICLA